MKKLLFIFVTVMCSFSVFATEYKITKEQTIKRATDDFSLTSEWEETEGGYSRTNYQTSGFSASLWSKDGSAMVMATVSFDDADQAQVQMLQAIASCSFFSVSATGNEASFDIMTRIINSSMKMEDKKASIVMDGFKYESVITVAQGGLIVMCATEDVNLSTETETEAW